jgi:hypothetical protein
MKTIGYVSANTAGLPVMLIVSQKYHTIIEPYGS